MKGLLIASIVSVAFQAGVASAQPAPDSLRVDLTPWAVRLTWDGGARPYGVYRSSNPQAVADPASYHAVTNDTLYDDWLQTAPGPILFYLVDASPTCEVQADCDNADPCDGEESCQGALSPICTPGTSPCDDDDPCTANLCSPVSGECSFTPPDCDDGSACTVDACIPGVGCEYSVAADAGVGHRIELAGNSLAEYPFFEHVRAFNEDASVEFGLDPGRLPELAGRTCDLYVVEARSAKDWCDDRALADVRGAPDTRTFAPASGAIQDNTFALAGAFQLASTAGDAIGKGYDVVADCDRDGLLDADEPADGLADRAGFYVLRDLTGAGPRGTSQFDDFGASAGYGDFIPIAGGGSLRVYYPDVLDIAWFSGRFPLVVISHGNGHAYNWYDFLGHHLASYGHIVMSHFNDTVPGIESASATTLEFTDLVIGEQATLGGGVLDGHIDASRIAWIGHSRGGEGVVRAYDRIVDEGYSPEHFDARDILVISSIAPTNFLGPAKSHPHGVPYHLLYGSADGDVCGCPQPPEVYSFALFERATGYRHSTYVHGADHNDFNCCGPNDFTGPFGTQIGRTEAQRVQKAIQLATVERYLEGSPAAEDLFWRQYERLRPIGVAPSTIVVNEYREGPLGRGFVVDDYQSEPDVGTSSSGGAVGFDVSGIAEELTREADDSFDWTGFEPMNGMTRGSPQDQQRAVVFNYGPGDDRFYEMEIVAGMRDFSDHDFLSFRACQGTRAPWTVAALEDLVFTVTLEDGDGATSSIRIGAYGGGIEEPYQRGGFGFDDGWQNEFETIRIRLTDFLNNGSGIDLTDVVLVRFDFGSSFGSERGRLALDDVELVED